MKRRFAGRTAAAAARGGGRSPVSRPGGWRPGRFGGAFPASLAGKAPRSSLDEFLVTVSRAADHSVLWLAVAGAMALAGDRRGKLAAKRGVAAIAVASAAVNGPLKLAVRRRRPPPRRLAGVRQPRSSSFPSGHSASAFAFATAATRELPAVGPLLFPLAATVAYSRVRVGVHYPGDVVAGGAIGVAAAVAAVPLTRGLVRWADRGRPAAGDAPPLREAVLVVSPHAGASGGLDRARRVMERLGLRIAAQLHIEHVDELPKIAQTSGGQPRLVIAAGGDGTVGTVADRIVNGASVLGVLPLGTSNDFARALGIPIHPERAAELLVTGKVSTIDLGRLQAPGQPARHFVHAATVGLNVNFAKLATRASMRDHLGRFTYLVAASNAIRRRPSFECDLYHDGGAEKVTLSQLSVINAPIFGGALGLSVAGSNPDDRLLDVLAFEDIPARRMLLAALFLLLRVKRQIAGVRTFHLARLHVHTEQPLDVALDGEIVGNLPGDFEVVGNALRVITPQDFVDVDD